MKLLQLTCMTLLLAFGGGAQAQASSTEQEVAHLVAFVTASGCIFNRNGSQYKSVDAADHLELKYSRGKRWVNSAEQFIDRLASSSSLSKKPYTVTCKGEEIASGRWLHTELTRYRAEPSITPPIP